MFLELNWARVLVQTWLGPELSMSKKPQFEFLKIF